MDDLDELLAFARDLSDRGSALLLERLHEPRSDVRTKSTGTDMVSEVDDASERLIVDAIRETRPDDGILSEEGANSDSASGYRWVIDPVDGTTNYLYGHPGFGVSIIEQSNPEVAEGRDADAASAAPASPPTSVPRRCRTAASCSTITCGK